MNWEIVGTVAVVVTVMSFFPQLYRSYRTKRVDDISYYFILLLMTAQVLWIAYGAAIINMPILVTNSILFVCASTLITMKYFYSKKT